MNGGPDPFLIGISASLFSIGTQECSVPRQGDLIAFRTACLSENVTYTFRALP